MIFIVVDVIERMIDLFYLLLNPVPGGKKLGLKNRHVLDRIFPESLLEFWQKARQVILLNTAEDFLVFIPVSAIHISGKVRIRLIMKGKILKIAGHAFSYFCRCPFFLPVIF